jgi:predicted transcriptional regulator YheO
VILYGIRDIGFRAKAYTFVYQLYTVTEKDTVDNNRHSMRSGENTSKELTELEEVSARIATLVDMLHEKGVINKKVFERTLAMRLHEISKATVFAEMSD